METSPQFVKFVNLGAKNFFPTERQDRFPFINYTQRAFWDQSVIFHLTNYRAHTLWCEYFTRQNETESASVTLIRMVSFVIFVYIYCSCRRRISRFFQSMEYLLICLRSLWNCYKLHIHVFYINLCWNVTLIKFSPNSYSLWRSVRFSSARYLFFSPLSVNIDTIHVYGVSNGSQQMPFLRLLLLFLRFISMAFNICFFFCF